MKEREYIAKHGHERIGDLLPKKDYASITISREDIELAKKDDNEIIRIMSEKIRQANEALIEAAIKKYFRMLDE